MSAAFELKGGDELARLLEQLGPRARKAGAAALYAEGLRVSKVSQERTPVDTGALRASHEVGRPEGERAEDLTVTVRVGGPAAPYALIVHENLEAKHPVGQAKFLESAVLEASGTWTDRLAERLRAALEKEGR